MLLVGINQGAAGAIVGNMQLYSMDRKISQPLQEHAGCFATIKLAGETVPRMVFSFIEKKEGSGPKIYVMEVGNATPTSFKIAPRDVPFPADAGADFPLYLFDAHTGTPMYRNRISDQTIFVTCALEASGGVAGVTARTGQVLHIGLNEPALVPFILQTLRNPELALSIASRCGLPGVEELYVTEFNRRFASGDLKAAAQLAADAPNNLLRSPEVIARFQAAPAQLGQPAPILLYFATLLERIKLTAVESIELARHVQAQGRGAMIEKWLLEDKLECSETLGDMVVSVDGKMALSIYLRANATEKVIQCFLATGRYRELVQYAVKVNYRPAYIYMLQSMIRSNNPRGAEEFARMLATAEGGPLVDVNMVVDAFMQLNAMQETTSFLLDVLKVSER